VKFLDINVTKERLGLLLRAINSPFYWRILKAKPFHQKHFVERKNEDFTKVKKPFERRQWKEITK
jgi:hypothetical protein